jgi:hypothetical protein
VNFGDKLLNALDAAISPSPHALARRLAEKRGFKLTAAEITALKQADGIVAHCQAAVTATDGNAAAAAFRKSLADYQSALETGQTPPPLKTRTEIEHQFLLQCEYAGIARNAAINRLRTLCQPISERFAVELEREAAKLEESEKALHAEYGVEHSAGGLAQKLRDEAAKVRRATTHGHSLASLLPFLTEI